MSSGPIYGGDGHGRQEDAAYPLGVPVRPITTATRIAGVIGDPVTHSLSPALQNAAFVFSGIDAVFVAWQIKPNDLAAAIAGMKAMGVIGASVTVPHKHAVAPLCDQLAAPADAIGAVNCLEFERKSHDVRIIGHNTDAAGFTDSLVRDADFDPNGSRAIILGAGGAARAVHAGLLAAGAHKICIVARQPASVRWIEAEPWTAETLAKLCRETDLVVDATSAGLSPERELAVPAQVPVELLPDSALVSSLIYHREPLLLDQARQRGLKTLDGAGMLVHQGARAFSLWTGMEAPLRAMWIALRAAREAIDEATLG